MANDGVTLELKGYDELYRKLRALPENVQPKIIKSAVFAGGKIIAEQAKSNIHSRTGTLSGAVGQTGKKGEVPWEFTTYIGAVKKTRVKGKSRLLGYYGHIVEQGSQPHWIPKITGKIRKEARRLGHTGQNDEPIYIPKYGKWFWRVHHKGARPQPWLKPAADAKWRQAVDVVGRELGKQIDKAMRKLGK